MRNPVLVTPAAELPISVEEVARLINKVTWVGEAAEVEDAENIEFQIRAAIDHYQGWNGILGISLADQEWRQDYDRFNRDLPIVLGPVLSDGLAVTWRNAEGQISAVSPSSYALRFDRAGRALVRFDSAYSFPGDVYEHDGVSVTYRAGYADLPHDIKAAIVMRVQLHLDEAATSAADILDKREENLVSKYRRRMV